MSDKKTKGKHIFGIDLAAEEDKQTVVECRLITRGTQKANAKAIDDLAVPDPELAIGKQVIRDALEEEIEDGSQSKRS